MEIDWKSEKPLYSLIAKVIQAIENTNQIIIHSIVWCMREAAKHLLYYFHCKQKLGTKSRITGIFVQMWRFLPVAITNFLLLFSSFFSSETHFYSWCVHFDGIGNNFNRWLSISKRETAIHAYVCIKKICINVYVGQQNFYFFRIEITIIYTNRNVLQLFSISPPPPLSLYFVKITVVVGKPSSIPASVSLGYEIYSLCSRKPMFLADSWAKLLFPLLTFIGFAFQAESICRSGNSCENKKFRNHVLHTTHTHTHKCILNIQWIWIVCNGLLLYNLLYNLCW